MPSSSTTRSSGPAAPSDDAAARGGLGHRVVSGALAVEGAERTEFLQGQLTQDVRGLTPGDSRLAAGLTPKGKLLYFGRLVAEPERFLLLLPAEAIPAALAHLTRYAAFQKVAVRDASEETLRIALYGPAADGLAIPEGVRLTPEGELAGEILAPAVAREAVLGRLAAAGSVPVSEETAEVLRIEAGRPLLNRDATGDNLPDEVGLGDAIAPAKGCYVGQEVVARLRTYGRANRRLAGFRFPEGPVDAGTVFEDPGKPGRDLARVTSSAVSPRLGPIGLGLVFRDVAPGTRLERAGGPEVAVVCGLPLA